MIKNNDKIFLKKKKNGERTKDRKNEYERFVHEDKCQFDDPACFR